MISTILKWGVGNRMIQISKIYIKSKINNIDYIFDDKYCFRIMHNTNEHYSTNIFSKLNFNYTYYDIFTNYTEEQSNDEYLKIINNIKLNTKYDLINTSDIDKYYDNFITCDYDFSFDLIFLYQYQKELQHLFINEDVINKLKIKYINILKNSVSIHIRRGDYISDFPQLLKSNSYYFDNIEKIEKHKKIENILIFSDDIQWCKENIIDDRITYIEGQQDYEDLYLMSLCENNIIIDSSFSWWGAFLNENENKIILRPVGTIWK